MRRKKRGEIIKSHRKRGDEMKIRMEGMDDKRGDEMKIRMEGMDRWQ